jgi:hypothetical protein
MLNSIAKLIGCTALVVTVAVVFYVIVIQLDKAGPRIDPAYVAEAAESTQNYRWSGAEPLPKDPRLGVSRPVLAKADGESVPSLANSMPGQQSKTPKASLIDVEVLRPAIEEIVRKFFLASSVAEKVACSRDGERVQPLMERYYQKHPLSDAVWQKLGWVLPMDEPGHQLAYAQSLFADGEPVCLIIEQLADGALKVDWESSVRYSELDWKEFLSSRPDHPTLFRVIASKPIGVVDVDDGAAGQEVIELKHPAEQGTVYAYFNRDDPQFRPLLDQLQSGNWTNVPLTLRLCYPGPTSNARAVRIAGVEGKGWLILHHKRS